MKFLVLVLFTVLLFACSDKDKRIFHEEKYENGQVKRAYYKVNGLFQDTMFDYYNTGELKKIRLFKNGKQHGRALNFYKTGELEEVQYFVDGLQEGGDTLFYKNGNKKFTAQFVKNLKTGPFQRWSEHKDSMELETMFRNDTLLLYKTATEK
ncbi:MAG: hypothetical protein IPO72_15105 [Saprospiraceae bacterium]|nr:hypothetical protein [Candidatus Vicinibacter affinis]MBK9642561.1 hypothetical protein [Candidatus Vicinibacter affinis]